MALENQVPSQQPKEPKRLTPGGFATIVVAVYGISQLKRHYSAERNRVLEQNSDQFPAPQGNRRQRFAGAVRNEARIFRQVNKEKVLTNTLQDVKRVVAEILATIEAYRIAKDKWPKAQE